jgi:hypothetical protein
VFDEREREREVQESPRERDFMRVRERSDFLTLPLKQHTVAAFCTMKKRKEKHPPARERAIHQ